MLLSNIERILEIFGVETREYSNRFSGTCPIHKGDNQTAFTVYKETGAWKCFTHGCHEKYGSGLVGLVMGLLASKNLPSQYKDACKVMHQIGDTKEQCADSINRFYLSKPENLHSKITRDKVRSRLEIPAAYFIEDRGFAPETLDKYDVGLCKNKNSKFYNRCVVPIYDINYEFMVGCTARTIDKKDPKWLHSYGFSKDDSLYNAWFAKHHIEKSGTAIIVESPGNIWSLEESDIHCGVAIFGTELTFGQMRMLSQLGVLNLVILMDNDDAGKSSTIRLVDKLKGLYNIIVPKIDYGDLAECPREYLKSTILPILREL